MSLHIADNLALPAEAVTQMWRPVPGFEGDYEVSEYGQVRRVSRGRGARAGRILTQSRMSTGYFEVRMGGAKRHGRWLVHRLVAFVFIGPPPFDDAHVNHIDGNPAHNHFSNLEWVTPRQNIAHSLRAGLAPRGANRGHAKLTDDDVRAIRQAAAIGEGVVAIARRYGVSHSLVSGIVSGKRWRHVQ